jgi:hypothetical protein
MMKRELRRERIQPSSNSSLRKIRWEKFVCLLLNLYFRWYL